MKQHVLKGETFLLLFLLFLAGFSNFLCHAKDTSLDISKGNIVISKSGSYTITGNSKANTIIVKKGVSADITLKDVTIESESISPITIEKGGAANFILLGKNTVSTQRDAAISVSGGAKFIVSALSTGTLNAHGGLGGAGIGESSCGNNENGVGTIIIKGGTISAYGGPTGAGIGSVGEWWENTEDTKRVRANDITISGGNVTAIGGDNSVAGIGGVNLNKQGKITISGGTVYASSNGCGIGSESIKGYGHQIKITGGNVSAFGNNCGAAIGDSISLKGTTVTISGGMVYAYGDCGEREIFDYSRAYASESNMEFHPDDIAAEKIVITGGHVEAFQFSTDPVNAKGAKLAPILFNCKSGEVSSITIGKASYGCKDIVSNGYLSCFVPYGSSMKFTVKSGKNKLYEEESLTIEKKGGVLWENRPKQDEMTVDLDKSDLELFETGFVYDNQLYGYYGTDPTKITIKGEISKGKIRVRGGEHHLIFDSVKITRDGETMDYFLQAGHGAKVDIMLKGKNLIQVNGKIAAFMISYGSTVSFSAASGDTNSFVAKNGGKFIEAIGGEVAINNGIYQFQTDDKSYAVYLGTEGTYSLYGGTCDMSACKPAGIVGFEDIRCNVYGGLLKVITMGYYEDYNGEVVDNSLFRMTGGEVQAEQRIIFANYLIYGGNISARIFGSGTGCKVTMYDGTLSMGRFIDTYEDGYGEQSNINTKELYGGKVTVRNDVPDKEVEAIPRYKD